MPTIKVDIEGDAHDNLVRLSQKLGISKGGVVRNAISLYARVCAEIGNDSRLGLGIVQNQPQIKYIVNVPGLKKS